MPTYNQLQAQVIREKWLGKLMTCVYNDKRRVGIVRFVKQGPAIEQNNGEYFYMNEPDGKVYVDFHQDDGKMRCFLWAKVVDPRPWGTERRLSKQRQENVEREEAKLAEALAVRRPRPVE
jgi:hypothetical protein